MLSAISLPRRFFFSAADAAAAEEEYNARPKSNGSQARDVVSFLPRVA